MRELLIVTNEYLTSTSLISKGHSTSQEAINININGWMTKVKDSDTLFIIMIPAAHAAVSHIPLDNKFTFP